MKSLIVLKDKDIFGDVDDSQVSYIPRTTVKVILFDSENRIALFGIKYLLLPGGGVEDGESFEETAKRECLEEVGCEIKIGEKIGFTEEYRAKIERHQTTHCFVAEVIGEKCEPYTPQEDELKARTKWVSVKDALQLLRKQKDDITSEHYSSCFNIRTHLVFLEEYIRNHKK